MVKEEPKKIEITSVVTSTAPAFQLPTGEVVGLEQYLVYLGNIIVNIEKAVV